MTDPIKLAIEAMESCVIDYYDMVFDEEKVPKALAALRSIKPPCQMCVQYTVGMNSGIERCTLLAQDCTNFDNFQALSPVNLTKETKL